jgi:membrane-associated phospholipid phosphatase
MLALPSGPPRRADIVLNGQDHDYERFAPGGRAQRFAPAVVGVGLLVPFLLLGLEARRDNVLGWDKAILSFLHGAEEGAHGSFLDLVANGIIGRGGTATMLLGLLLLAISLSYRRTRDALFVITTSVAILTLTPLLKEQFERADLKYSFPSGHAARSAALVTAAIMIAWPTRFRWPVLAVGVLFATSLGTVLVWEDWHLPSDVVGGWCLGIACAAAAWTVLGLLERRFWPPDRRLQPPDVA